MKNIVILGLFALIVLSGCTSQSERKLVYGIIDYPGLAPAYLAQEKEFFEKQGVEVELLPIQDFASLNSGLSTGKLDLITSTADSFAIASANGVRGKVIYSSSRSNGADGLLVRKDIQSVSDLQGKTVALEIGSPSHFFLLKTLEKEGLSGSDVTILDMPPGDAGAAFASGKIPAAVTFEPWLTAAKENGNGHILADSRSVPVILDTFLASENALANKQDQLKRFMAAWFDAVEYAKEHPGESNEIMGAAYGMNGADFALFLEEVELYDLQESKEVTASLPLFMDDVQKLWMKEGFIENTKSGSDIITQQLLEELG